MCKFIVIVMNFNYFSNLSLKFYKFNCFSLKLVFDNKYNGQSQSNIIIILTMIYCDRGSPLEHGLRWYHKKNNPIFYTLSTTMFTIEEKATTLN